MSVFQPKHLSPQNVHDQYQLMLAKADLQRLERFQLCQMNDVIPDEDEVYRGLSNCVTRLEIAFDEWKRAQNPAEERPKE